MHITFRFMGVFSIFAILFIGTAAWGDDTTYYRIKLDLGDYGRWSIPCQTGWQGWAEKPVYWDTNGYRVTASGKTCDVDTDGYATGAHCTTTTDPETDTTTVSITGTNCWFDTANMTECPNEFKAPKICTYEQRAWKLQNNDESFITDDQINAETDGGDYYVYLKPGDDWYYKTTSNTYNPTPITPYNITTTAKSINGNWANGTRPDGKYADMDHAKRRLFLGFTTGENCTGTFITDMNGKFLTDSMALAAYSTNEDHTAYACYKPMLVGGTVLDGKGNDAYTLVPTLADGAVSNQQPQPPYYEVAPNTKPENMITGYTAYMNLFNVDDVDNPTRTPANNADYLGDVYLRSHSVYAGDTKFREFDSPAIKGDTKIGDYTYAYSIKTDFINHKSKDGTVLFPSQCTPPTETDDPPIYYKYDGTTTNDVSVARATYPTARYAIDAHITLAYTYNNATTKTKQLIRGESSDDEEETDTGWANNRYYASFYRQPCFPQVKLNSNGATIDGTKIPSNLGAKLVYAEKEYGKLNGNVGYFYMGRNSSSVSAYLPIKSVTSVISVENGTAIGWGTKSYDKTQNGGLSANAVNDDSSSIVPKPGENDNKITITDNVGPYYALYKPKPGYTFDDNNNIKAKTFTIKFVSHCDGNNTELGTATATYDADIPEYPGTTFPVCGTQLFQGFNTKSDGTGDDYYFYGAGTNGKLIVTRSGAGETTIPTWTTDADDGATITLYAKWQSGACNVATDGVYNGTQCAAGYYCPADTTPPIDTWANYYNFVTNYDTICRMKCPDGYTSAPGAKSIEDCYKTNTNCTVGMQTKPSGVGTATCESGFYCPGETSGLSYGTDTSTYDDRCRIVCPDGYTSAPGASSINDCYKQKEQNCRNPGENKECPPNYLNCNYINASTIAKQYYGADAYVVPKCELDENYAFCKSGYYYSNFECLACSDLQKSDGTTGFWRYCVNGNKANGKNACFNRSTKYQCLLGRDFECPTHAVTCPPLSPTINGALYYNYEDAQYVRPYPGLACSLGAFTCEAGYKPNYTNATCDPIVYTLNFKSESVPNSGEYSNFVLDAGVLTWKFDERVIRLDQNNQSWYQYGRAPSIDGYIFQGFFTSSNSNQFVLADKTTYGVLTSDTGDVHFTPLLNCINGTDTGCTISDTNITLYARWEACPAGYSCDGGNQTKCAAGTYSPAGDNQCHDCAANTYSAAGAAECTACNAGYESTTGASECSKIKYTLELRVPGNYTDITNQNSIFQLDSGGIITWKIGEKPKLSDDGTIGTFGHAPTLNSYDFVGFYTTIDDATGKLVLGTDTTQKTLLTNTNAHGEPLANCINGVSGANCTINGKNIMLYSHWQTCPAGYSCEGGNKTPCPVGTYSPAGQNECLACPAGTYNNKTGQESCTPCPAGQYSATTGATSCELCPAGTYSDTTGTIQCTACPDGQTSAAGQTICIACPAGYSCTDPANPTLCPAGTYSPLGDNECHDCAAGTYSAAGASECTLCATLRTPKGTSNIWTNSPVRATEPSQCYVICTQIALADGAVAIPVDPLARNYDTLCEYKGKTADGDDCDIILGPDQDVPDSTTECKPTSCRGGFVMNETTHKCEPCNTEGALTYRANGTCIPETCISGYHSNGLACEANVVECTADNATHATRTWDARQNTFGQCTITACDDGYHISSNTCVTNSTACVIPNGIGMREWDTTSGQWGACIPTQCNPGYTSDASESGDTTAACGVCRNMFGVNGERAVSSYITGCEIATCMYQGERYNLENNECVAICPDQANPAIDETGTMSWNPITHKCERKCKPGFTLW